jgi:phage shock protein A
LIKVRQAYAEAIASQRRLQRQKDQVEGIANDWYHRAQLALQRNNEGLAREALARRQLELDKANTLRMQIDTQNVAIDKLYTAMNALENKIREAAATKEQLVARARTAKTTAAVNDMLSGLTGKTSMDAFNRMQEKVEALEAAAEASAEMSLLPSGVDSSLESEFRMLEQSSAVDLELEKMKKSINETRMLGSSMSNMEESFRERVKIPVGQGANNKYQ